MSGSSLISRLSLAGGLCPRKHLAKPRRSPAPPPSTSPGCRQGSEPATAASLPPAVPRRHDPRPRRHRTAAHPPSGLRHLPHAPATTPGHPPWSQQLHLLLQSCSSSLGVFLAAGRNSFACGCGGPSSFVLRLQARVHQRPPLALKVCRWQSGLSQVLGGVTRGEAPSLLVLAGGVCSSVSKWASGRALRQRAAPETCGKGTQNLPCSSTGRKRRSLAQAAQCHITTGFAVTDSHQSRKSDRFIFNQIKHLLLTEHISAQPGQAFQRAAPTGET